ncbi:MAG: hypothetical protein WCC53_16515 [Thermoanaerobaculia bacterium]|jgi:hypothetical protein
MKNTMRNLTLSAAALAALTVIAPKASAEPWKNFPLPPSPRQVREMWRERHESPRHEFRERGTGYGQYGRAYAAPVRPYVRYGYAAPFRVLSGFRFYAACPGPGYVYIANYGWALPPYYGAVWIPGHYDFEGFWIEGHWR